MSDRRDAYFRQLVDEAFFDSCFDDLEAADRLLAVDMGFIGVVSGGVVTQHVAPPDLTVDISGPCAAYDQAGRRMGIPAGINGFNCAVDENGVATTVAAPGNERWLSLQLRFDRTLADPQVDGNGLTVQTDQDESYELAIVMGVEQAAGTGLAGPGYVGRPALPADGRLLCDIVLIFGQTQIFTVADINTDRRQDFSIFGAADIPVVSGGWGFLAPATDDVQATFDFIDARIAQRDAAGDMLHDLIPSVAGRHLGSGGKEWDAYLLELVMTAAARVDGNLIPKVTGADLGAAAGPLRWSLFADLVNLDGDMVPSAAARVNGNWIPTAAGNNLGAAASEWDLYVLELVTVAASRVDGDLIPKAGTEVLGSAALRWALHSEVVTNYTATLVGAWMFDAAKAFGREMDLAPLEQPSWVATTWVWGQNAAWGGRNITGWTYSSGAATAGDIRLDFPHGVTVTDLLLTWYQAAAAAALVAEVWRLDYQGAQTSLGSFTISASGAWKDKEAMGLVNFVVDRDSYRYVLRITGVAGQDCALTGINMEATVLDFGKAAI